MTRVTVLDSSFVLEWALDQGRFKARRAFFEDVLSRGAWVPAIWPMEIANVIAQNHRKTAVRGGHERLIAGLWLLDVRVEPQMTERVWKDVLALAFVHGLSSYDASYLELAKRIGADLVTLDEDLAKAATREGVGNLGV